MQTLAQMRQMLAERGLQPKKRFGQNFLVDRNLLAKLVDASGVGAGDLVLEVGPGTGTLTEELLGRGCEVVACELDRDLAELMRETLGERERFTLHEGDCLAGKRAISPQLLEILGGREFALVANLPYAAATPLMFALLLDHPACRSMAVTVQREVADRFLADAGTKAYGPLSIARALTGEGAMVAQLPPESFWPRPDVQSAMMTWIRTSDGDGARDACDTAQKLFTQRRKHLRAAWRSLKLGKEAPEGLPSDERVEALEPGMFIALAEAQKRING